VTTAGDKKALLSVRHVTEERPAEAIHQGRDIERPKTTRITPCLDDALPKERGSMLVVVEVV
jgi:hypothetical protein